PPTEVHTRSLHDALPICSGSKAPCQGGQDGSRRRSAQPFEPAEWLPLPDTLPQGSGRLFRGQAAFVGKGRAALCRLPFSFGLTRDRKSTRLNSSHVKSSY